MGASVGVVLDQMTPELREAFEHNEKQKFTIAEYDAAMLDRETAKVFKKHGKIIKTLTSRTKAQLKRTISLKNRVPDDIYKIVGGNNNYAMFMKQLHMSKQEIEMENLRNSSKTELYDEEMLINIVGTSTNKELKTFCELYEKEKGTPLSDVFVAKTKPESQLQRFIKMCWKFDRGEGKNVDEKLAAEQAAEIHKAGAARLLGCDEEVIFKILVENSRAQCAAIADQYLTQFHMKFERAINMKFKGNCGKLMLLWAWPIPMSIVTCINSYEERMIIDKVAIISMVSKYDKDILSQVDIAAEKTYEKNLVSIVQRGLSGNLLKAVTGWIENASPDKGYERVTTLFLENQQSFGRSLDELFQSSEFQQRLLFLMNKESDELSKFMKDNRIKFNPEDKLDLKQLSGIGSVDSFDSFHTNNSNKGDPKDRAVVVNKFAKKTPEVRATSEYDEKYHALQEYFKSYFSEHDKKKVGLFDETEFWDLMKQLPLEALGLTESEVESMAQWCEWVADGKVNYHEAIFELADSTLSSIEAKTAGETDVLTVVADLSKGGKLHKAWSEAKVARHDSVDDISNVPDYFLQYIYDTFYAYDFDNNGYLCIGELNAVLPVLNLGMTYTDFIEKETDHILHKDAVQLIARKVQPWFLDYENDNYICLVDKDSGLFFWYNCKDESSQWADEEGQGWAGYGSRRASTNQPDSFFRNSFKMTALGSPLCSPSIDERKVMNNSPPRSPRAPTSADEKEMDAKSSPRGAELKSSSDGIASEGIASEGIASEGIASEPKTRGIAERVEEEEEAQTGSNKGDETKGGADQAEAKTADPTPSDSEKKGEDGSQGKDSKSEDKDDKEDKPDSKGDEDALAKSPRAVSGSPRGETSSAASLKLKSGSIRASPRGEEEKKSPRGAEPKVPDVAHAAPAASASVDENATKPASPRPGPAPASATEDVAKVVEEPPIPSDDSDKKVNADGEGGGETAAPSLDAGDAEKEKEKPVEGEPAAA